MKNAALKTILAALAFLLLWAILRHSPHAGETLRGFLAWVERAGPWGLALYGLMVAATVALLLPGLVLSLGGGFLFGVVPGTLLFVAGETLGACAAFALAHRFLQGRTRGYFSGHPRLGILNETLSSEGWKFIALTRMTPFFPFKLSNYFFGAMGFRFADFFWGTLLGTLPLSFVMVYLGSLIPDLSGIESRNAWQSPLARGFALAFGGIAVIGLFFISRRAGKRYRVKVAALEEKRK